MHHDKTCFGMDTSFPAIWVSVLRCYSRVHARAGLWEFNIPGCRNNAPERFERASSQISTRPGQNSRSSPL